MRVLQVPPCKKFSLQKFLQKISFKKYDGKKCPIKGAEDQN